jgi:hypothetical protein
VSTVADLGFRPKNKVGTWEREGERRLKSPMRRKKNELGQLMVWFML